MNKIKWLFAMMMVVAMFAMTACEVAPSAKTIGEINYKPADTRKVKYYGFLMEGDSVVFTGEDMVAVAGVPYMNDKTTYDDVVQSIIASVNTTEGVVATLDGYTVDTDKPVADTPKNFVFKIKMTAKEGYKFAEDAFTTINVDLAIGKEDEILYTESDMNAAMGAINASVKKDGIGKLAVAQGIINGYDLNYQHSSSSGFLLNMAAPNGVNFIKYLLALGADKTLRMSKMGDVDVLMQCCMQFDVDTYEAARFYILDGVELNNQLDMAAMPTMHQGTALNFAINQIEAYGEELNTKLLDLINLLIRKGAVSGPLADQTSQAFLDYKALVAGKTAVGCNEADGCDPTGVMGGSYNFTWDADGNFGGQVMGVTLDHKFIAAKSATEVYYYGVGMGDPSIGLMKIDTDSATHIDGTYMSKLIFHWDN